ncbi:unnamed protein product [Adineta steineri]|uniref:Uncharacterized protein n=2 Tax=Adineta steineri TaxID=433720 RepID=A0A819B3L4_9BILA|nr:unnamed protein product [Adineta steineri]CAF0948775.1 unnamed protein product [Adineta steineri]CAF3794266.1 unnamed protein product [Adineta steineri]
MDLKLIKIWILSFFVALGFMHHSKTRMICHVIFILFLYSLIVLFGLGKRLLFVTSVNLQKLLGNDKVVLKPWTPKWKEEFKNEKTRLNKIILSKWKHIFHKELSPDGLVHIGSTSIEKIALAKPMHDVAIAITTKYLPVNLREDLEKAGYKYVGAALHSISCQDHWFFNITPKDQIDSKGHGFDLHVVLPPSHQWLRDTIHFSQYLTENQIDRERYGNLKSEIAKTDPTMASYVRKKQKLIHILFENSRQWTKNK